jgi:DegV family protein with EDD domain
MAKIAILTDSSANLSPEWIERYNIRVIPQKIHWGSETFLDGVDITPNEFYTRLSHSRSLPTTSQPSIQDFLQAFESLTDQADGIVALLISSGISGTVASAQSAASQFSRVPVEIVDTRVTSVGQALVVLAAARTAAQGKSLQEVRQAADEVVHRLHFFFEVDTLEYLHRGGRIGGASRFLGTAFKVKPILYFNPEGKLDALERVRTKARALQRLTALVEEKANGHPLHLGVLHASVPQIAQKLCEQIAHRLQCKEAFILELSPVIGVHVGPGAIGIAFYADGIYPEGG